MNDGDVREERSLLEEKMANPSFLKFLPLLINSDSFVEKMLFVEMRLMGSMALFVSFSRRLFEMYIRLETVEVSKLDRSASRMLSHKSFCQFLVASQNCG